VIAVSEATADDVTELLGIPRSRITVVHEAADPIFRASGASARHPREYFLHVGGTGPGKNLSTLLGAVRALECDSPCPPDLVVVGVHLRDVPAGDLTNVHVRPYVSDEELAAYYRGTLALVYPSVMEGFGLPVLEAMACGAPVITSSITATAEVAGGAALLLEDPYCVDELVRQMRRIRSDEELRRELAYKGAERASRFRWDNVVAETVAVYRAALRSSM
jgi:glycosyltransferase involved in cell wall biosynthesis